MADDNPFREANEDSPYGELTREEFYEKHQILHRESFMTNKQSMKIFTQSWQPKKSSNNQEEDDDDGQLIIKGLICMVHGYTSESGWIFELTAVALAKAGFLAVALDLQGHGSSEGPRDHVSDINPLVEDCVQYFDSIKSSHPSLPSFLYGESLGAAIATLICLRQGNKEWKGLVLSGAMCEISAKFKPLWPLEKLLPPVAWLAPYWRIAITKSPSSQSYRVGWKRKLAEKSPNRRTNGKATAASGLQLLRVCEHVRRNCGGIELPLLVIHGGEDLICDVSGARGFFECVASKDKTLKVYEGMWHLWIGETIERVEEVFGTVLDWIEVRAGLARKV